MLELAAGGAKVLMPRCVEYARRYDVPIHVRSSFSNKTGTWVIEHATDESEEAGWSRPSSPGSPTTASEAKITVVGVPDKPGEAARIFAIVAEAGDQHRHDRAERLGRCAPAAPTSRSRCPSADGQQALAALRDRPGRDRLPGRCCTTTRSARSRWSAPACARTRACRAKFFAALAEAGVNIEMISTSEIRISVVVSRDTTSTPRCARCTTRSSWTADDEQAVVYAGTGR